MQADLEYFKLCQKILDEGIPSNDRTGVGTLSIFGYQMRFDLKKEFPLLTSKKMFWNGVVDELLWFLSGSTNVNDLPERSRQLWKPWADDRGELGPIYGKQWRSTGSGIDQIQKVIESIKKDPYSRRHIVSAWNVEQLDTMSLNPCHVLFQFYVRNSVLSCQLYQRSGDVFLGIPFNIASYALLTHLIAHCCDLEVGELIHTIGDAHIYNNHISQIKEQISRTPYTAPTLELNKLIKNIDNFNNRDILLKGYQSHGSIKGTIAI